MPRLDVPLPKLACRKLIGQLAHSQGHRVGAHLCTLLVSTGLPRLSQNDLCVDWRGILQVANLMKEEIPQLYAMCGRGARSTLRVLRPGLAATEIAVSPLPGNPTGIWTIKRSYSDDYDAYIIVAFTNATLVSFIYSGKPQWCCHSFGRRVQVCMQ